MIEMAIVLPLLVLLVFGIVEYGLLFRERLTIASATASAARTGATLGAEDAADFRMLRALEAGLYDQVDSSVLISVDIFKAAESTGAKTSALNQYVFTPTTACRWTPCPDPSDPAYSWAGQNYLPADRDTSLDPSGGGLDVIGIEVRYQHTAVTEVIPGITRQLAERSLVRLEPDVFGPSSP